METTTIAIVDAQGRDNAGRRKTCARSSTKAKAWPGEWRRMNSHGGPPSGRDERCAAERAW